VTAAPRPAPGRGATILQRGRGKAYRPLPPEQRRSAFHAGLEAYERGDFFEAHELLEPAWMGAADLGERELYQGLIKLAAAYVHAVRGNPAGMARNLDGARERLAAAAADPDVRPLARGAGLDLPSLVADIDGRLSELARRPAHGSRVATPARVALVRDLPPPSTRTR
jgi:hypothetical protein